MSEIKFKVAEGFAYFGLDDVRYDAGVEHELKASKQTLELLAAANAAGVIEVSGKLPAVESDKDSLVKQAKAEKARHEEQARQAEAGYDRDLEAQELAAQKALGD